jgi:hypothetical protein
MLLHQGNVIPSISLFPQKEQEILLLNIKFCCLQFAQKLVAVETM